jgi:hypothetical protein
MSVVLFVVVFITITIISDGAFFSSRHIFLFRMTKLRSIVLKIIYIYSFTAEISCDDDDECTYSETGRSAIDKKEKI